VLGVAAHEVESGDVQAELLRLGELAEADAERDEVGARDRDGLAEERLADVVDARAVQAEDVGLQVGESRWRGRVVHGARGGEEVEVGGAGDEEEAVRVEERRRGKRCQHGGFCAVL